MTADPISLRRRSAESARILAALVAQVMAATPRMQSRDWLLLIEPRLQLGGDTLVPDLAAWRRDRRGGPPEWICDVVTGAGHVPATMYARHGVRVAWHINPAEQMIEVLAKRECGWWSTSHSMTLRAEPFQTIELDLQSIWQPS